MNEIITLNEAVKLLRSDARTMRRNAKGEYAENMEDIGCSIRTDLLNLYLILLQHLNRIKNIFTRGMCVFLCSF
jgi:hypothetical protein